MVCHICLDILKTPVVTPCGHVFCMECLISSSERSPNAMKAPCPTCRTTFSLVSPDPNIVPEKYRRFIDSNIRRVYMDNSIEATLQDKVDRLEARIKCLERQKDLLIGKCESHMTAADHHAQGEREARMQCAALRKELKQANGDLIEKGDRWVSFLDPMPPHLWGTSNFHPTSVPESSKRRNLTIPTGDTHSSVPAPINVNTRSIAPLPKRRRVFRRPHNESP